MMPDVLTETIAEHVPSFPQFLCEIWDHLYPGSPPPTYHVFYNRPEGAASDFTATVHFRPEPVANGICHAISSSVTAYTTRAIQEAAGDAIVFLRTYNSVMK